MDLEEILLAVSSSLNGVILVVVGYLLYKRKHIAEANKAETAAADNALTLEERIKEVTKKSAQEGAELDREKAAHERDNANYEFRLKMKESKLSDLTLELTSLREEFFILKTDLQELKKSELRCQDRLKLLEENQKEQEERNKKVVEYADRTAMLTALIRRAYKNGFLQNKDLEGTDIVTNV